VSACDCDRETRQIETQKKPLPYGIDSYREWLKREGIPVHEGLALNLFQLDTSDWPRFGVRGAAMRFEGGGDFCSMFLLDIPASAATIPVQHLYEAIYFVLEGRGSTQLEFRDGNKRHFEWGPGSFFAIPLNAKYRFFNASGWERALLVSTTTAPMVMKLFHNDEFVFNLPFEFAERFGPVEHTTGEGELHMIKPGQNTWQTNFVPDLTNIPLTAYDERGTGSLNIKFALADSPMHAHVSEIAPATYKKAHRHEGGIHVMTLTGGGYSLLWWPGDNDFQRVEWEYGVVFPPRNQQFHQHFVTSEQASRYVATGLGGVSYVFSESQRRTAGFDNQVAAGKRSVKEGGDQIEYEDQDPRIHEIWLEEMRKRGITPRFELPK